MGAGNLNHRELHQLIKMRTGGMSLSTHVTTDHSDMYAFEQVMVGWGGEVGMTTTVHVSSQVK